MSKPKIQTRQSAKQQRKDLEKALMKSFKMARDGEVAGMQHQGKIYIMMLKEVLEEGIRNNGQFNMSPEQKEFQKSYQKLLQTMSKLQYEQKARSEFETDEQHKMYNEMMVRNEKLFNGLDKFTFEFSDAISKTKAERKKVTDEFDKYFEDNPILEQIFSGRLK